MTTKIIALLSALLITGICIGQDILTYKNGTETKVKVIEVTSSEVKFKKFDNVEGPLYTVLKSDLFQVKYENGTKEVFSNPPPVTKETVPTEATEEAKESPNTVQKTKEDPEPEEDFGYERISYAGPRVGITFLGTGSAQDWLADNDYAPVITQFGWQFETRLFTVENGTSGLVEWVFLVGGIEKGLFLPSASMLLGIREGKRGLEFGIGPNLSVSGLGMAIAAGGSFKSGKIYFPVNLAVVPSVNNTWLSEAGQREHTGVRVSLLIGYNIRVR